LAKKYYTKIVDILKNEESLKDEEADKRNALLLAAHLNLAMCHLKQSNDVDAVNSCDEALKVDPKNEKGLFRRGTVKLMPFNLNMKNCCLIYQCLHRHTKLISLL